MAEALTHNLKLIGRYTLLRELRRDRYTAAYLASDPVLNREVVVKAVQLRPAPGQEATGHDRIDQAFMRQAQAAGRLHHPHMVTVFDAGRIQNVGYLALEKVQGRLLADALTAGFRPGDLQAADIVARVADAVEYAHARGIPHGHLGASRIYLQEPERTPKVMGFGGWIDTGVTGDFELAATESMLPYFENELSDDARRKDVRALGALLFLLMTGTRPDLKALRERRSSESPIVDLRPTAPLALAEIADSALELRGLRPWASAAEMRNALTAWLWGQADARGMPNAVTIARSGARFDGVATRPAATVPRPEPVPDRRAPTVRRRRWSVLRIGAASGALVAMVAFGSAWLDRGLAGAPRALSPPLSVKDGPESAHPGSGSVSGAVDAPARSSARTTVFGPAATGSASGAAPASANGAALKRFQ